MSEILSQVKADFIRAKERIALALTSTPDDKINWSPSSTARTPLQLVACAAIGTAGMKEVLSGKPFPYSNMAEMDANSRAKEKKITSRDQALKLLEDTSNEYLAWLDTLSPEKLQSMAKMPMGEIPMTVAVTFPGGHIQCRACQLDYIQTVYGDLDWHMENE